MVAPLTVGPATPAPAPAPIRSPGGERSSFGETLARVRAASSLPSSPSSPSSPLSASAVPLAHAPGQVALESPLTAAGRQLLARVAHGERYVESVVRQALHGRAFTPADLLAMQAEVYRYTQELELVSKLVDRGTSTVRTIMQQNG